MSNEERNVEFEIYTDKEIHILKMARFEVTTQYLAIYSDDNGEPILEAIFRNWDKMVKVKKDA